MRRYALFCLIGTSAQTQDNLMRRLDPQRGALDPGAVFRSPRDVIECEDLSRQQTIEMLLGWADEAAERPVGPEEGMPGRENDLQGRYFLCCRGACAHRYGAPRTDQRHRLPHCPRRFGAGSRRCSSKEKPPCR